jgi:hypothetical protein
VRVVLENARPEDVGGRRGPQWKARVSRVRLFHCVHREESQRVDASPIERFVFLHGVPPRSQM